MKVVSRFVGARGVGFFAGLALALCFFLPAQASPVPLELNNGSAGLSFSHSAGAPGQINESIFTFVVTSESAANGTLVTLALGLLNDLNIVSAVLEQLPGGLPPSGPYSFVELVSTPSFQLFSLSSVLLGPGSWELRIGSIVEPGALAGAGGGNINIAALTAPTPLPEPATLALVGFALLAAGAAGRVRART